MRAPYPFTGFDVVYVEACDQVVILQDVFRLQYWFYRSEIEEMANTPGFFKHLYKFALTLFPGGSNANQSSSVPELRPQVQHPSRCEQGSTPGYPHILSSMHKGTEHSSNGSSEPEL